MALPQDQPRPRATLILLAFNQEPFITEAVNAALSQDYEPLEIILSDDGSADATYQKMIAATSSYDGPHRVVTRRSPGAEGTLVHLYHAVAESTGEIIVLAAGDDVSRQDRVRRTVEHFTSNNCDALFSAYRIIDDKGQVVAPHHRFTGQRADLRSYFGSDSVKSIHGASSAYRKEVFERFSVPREKILFEDTFFSLMLGLADGKICFVDEPLVSYRQHSSSITNSDPRERNPEEIRSRERIDELSAKSMLNLLQHFEDAASHSGSSNVDLERVRNDMQFYQLRSNWISMPPLRRLGALLKIRRMWHLRWLLPRLLGLEAFVAMKGLRSAFF